MHYTQCMDDMAETQWQRRIFQPERKEEITLWSLLKSYAWHGKHHAAHIINLHERMKWN